MMAEYAIYKLEKIVDNPKFEGFAFVREESIRGKFIGNQSRIDWDFGPDDVKTNGRDWTITPLAPFWTAQPVVGRVHNFNDYPCINLTIPAFSRRAVDALRDFLEPNGELLPLVSTVGEYYAFNTTTIADILDEARSEIDWLSDKHTFDQVFDINRYEFFPEKVVDLSIFRLVEMSSTTYVSQMFVDRVREHDLQGFHFVKLWPISEGAGSQAANRKQRKLNSKVKTKRGTTKVNGNTVVLLLPIAKAKPSKAEHDRLTNLMNEIDMLLYDPASAEDAPYSGSLEGNDTFNGQIRLFLSCPNADALVEKMRPWLKSLTWKGGVQVLKRYGEYVDVNCSEEYVDL